MNILFFLCFDPKQNFLVFFIFVLRIHYKRLLFNFILANLSSTTEACSALQCATVEACPCMHYNVLCCTSMGPWAEPGVVWTSVACDVPVLIYTVESFAALGRVNTMGHELYLDNVDMSTLHCTVLYLDVSTLQGLSFTLRVYTSGFWASTVGFRRILFALLHSCKV